MNKISFSTLKINLFKSNENQAVNKNHHNPFAMSFRANSPKDVFELSEKNEVKAPNMFTQRTQDYMNKISLSFEGAKTRMKEAMSPVISFGSKIREGFKKVSEIKISDVIGNIKEEMKMLSIDSEVRGYMKKPVSELREMLVQEAKA